MNYVQRPQETENENEMETECQTKTLYSDTYSNQ